MQHRVLLAVIGGACLSLVACNQEKKEASPEPATTAATPATATTTEAPAAKAEETDKAGAAQPSTEEKTDTAAVNAPTTKVANGEKEVKTDGKDLAVKNESGKGGVTTNPGGGVKVTGKSGKSIAVPGL